MRAKIIFAITTTGLLFVWSCKKKETAPDPVTPLEFSSLIIEPDTVHPSDLANVTAVANGDNLNFQWSTSHGDLFGSGSSVTYGAAPCCVGTNTIYCKVSDGKKSIIKEVKIEVEEHQ